MYKVERYYRTGWGTLRIFDKKSDAEDYEREIYRRSRYKALTRIVCTF